MIDNDTRIAILRLKRAIDISRDLLSDQAFLNSSTGVGAIKNRYKAVLQQLQNNISELEDRLSKNPQTVEETTGK